MKIKDTASPKNAIARLNGFYGALRMICLEMEKIPDASEMTTAEVYELYERAIDSTRDLAPVLREMRTQDFYGDD